MIQKKWLKQTDSRITVWYQYVELKNFYDELIASPEWRFMEATKELLANRIEESNQDHG